MTRQPMFVEPDDVPEYREGVRAFDGGRTANECPYSFKNTPHYPTDYSGFNRSYRHKLDAWMRGWITAKRETVAAIAETKERE